LQTVLNMIQIFFLGGFRPFFNAESKNDLRFEIESIFGNKELFL
jgi:hypothetical protein